MLKGIKTYGVKIDTLPRDFWARYDAGGHLTGPPTQLTCSSVVMHESVWIIFLITALNGLDVLSADARRCKKLQNPNLEQTMKVKLQSLYRSYMAMNQAELPGVHSWAQF